MLGADLEPLARIQVKVATETGKRDLGIAGNEEAKPAEG